jgi:hypothetical protein
VSLFTLLFPLKVRLVGAFPCSLPLIYLLRHTLSLHHTPLQTQRCLPTSLCARSSSWASVLARTAPSPTGSVSALTTRSGVLPVTPTLHHCVVPSPLSRAKPCAGTTPSAATGAAPRWASKVRVMWWKRGVSRRCTRSGVADALGGGSSHDARCGLTSHVVCKEMGRGTVHVRCL